jgi:hypothetical protein
VRKAPIAGDTDLRLYQCEAAIPVRADDQSSGAAALLHTIPHRIGRDRAAYRDGLPFKHLASPVRDDGAVFVGSESHALVNVPCSECTRALTRLNQVMIIADLPASRLEHRIILLDTMALDPVIELERFDITYIRPSKGRVWFQSTQSTKEVL